MPQNNMQTTASGANAPQREKVSFRTNVTEIVGLEFDAGTLAPGRFGDQYMHFLSGNRIMWVDPAVNDLIAASGAKAGDDVAITKREERNGNRKRIVWDVARIEEEPWSASDDDIPPELGGRSQPGLAAAAGGVGGPKAPVSAAELDRIEAQARAADRSAAITAQRLAEAERVRPDDGPSAIGEGSERLTRCLRAAIAAAKDAEARGREIGRPVFFDSADIRAMAATLFIEARQSRL
jgi:hypothetical protein